MDQGIGAAGLGSVAPGATTLPVFPGVLAAAVVARRAGDSSEYVVGPVVRICAGQAVHNPEVAVEFYIGGAILYFVLMVTLGIMTLRKGHWVMFVVGIFLPLFGLIGAVIPPVRR